MHVAIDSTDEIKAIRPIISMYQQISILGRRFGDIQFNRTRAVNGRREKRKSKKISLAEN